jgi:hypothetical protein
MTSLNKPLPCVYLPKLFLLGGVFRKVIEFVVEDAVFGVVVAVVVTVVLVVVVVSALPVNKFCPRKKIF